MTVSFYLQNQIPGSSNFIKSIRIGENDCCMRFGIKEFIPIHELFNHTKGDSITIGEKVK